MSNYTPFRQGRPRIWETPEDMEMSFIDYCKFLKENQLEEIDYVGKDAEKVIRYKMRPPTIEGFCVWNGNTNTSFYDYQEREGFSCIIARIKEFCRSNCFDLAAAGFIKETIISRYLGLAEKKELTGENGSAISFDLTLRLD